MLKLELYSVLVTLHVGVEKYEYVLFVLEIQSFVPLASCQACIHIC